jgi:diazepam-binding inhibitor (GABA receptor modulating acyl-CoA-binding protein)
MGKDDELKSQFEEVAKELKKSGKSFDNDTLLKLYGYFKQSTAGDCNTECPSFFQLKEKAKWEAWIQHKGMKISHAMKKYIKLVEELLEK